MQDYIVTYLSIRGTTLTWGCEAESKESAVAAAIAASGLNISPEDRWGSLVSVDIEWPESEPAQMQGYYVEYRTSGGSCHSWEGRALSEDEAVIAALDDSYAGMCGDDWWHSLISVSRTYHDEDEFAAESGA